MKLLLCVLGLSLLLWGCGSGSSGENQSEKKGAGASVKEAVNDTADYITGAKHVKVQKVSTGRIDSLNQKHNDDLEKAQAETLATIQNFLKS